MQLTKQDALDAIGKLPDDADFDEIMCRLYVLDKIRKGQEAAEHRRTISQPLSSRLIYEIKGEDVVFLAVVHKRRELQPEMVERT